MLTTALDLDIPLSAEPRLFVADTGAGKASLKSIGANTRTRLWPLDAADPLVLVTTEGNAIAGFEGHLSAGEPSYMPPEGSLPNADGISLSIKWRQEAALKRSDERGLVVLEFEATTADEWFAVAEGVSVARSSTGQLAAIAVEAKQAAFEEFEIVFDPTKKCKVEIDDGWLEVWSSGWDQGPGLEDEMISLCTAKDGQFGHMSANCGEDEIKDVPVAVSTLDERTTLRTRAAGGFRSGHVRNGDEIICVLTFRNAPEGEWVRLGDKNLLLCVTDEGELVGIAGIGKDRGFMGQMRRPWEYDADASPVRAVAVGVAPGFGQDFEEFGDDDDDDDDDDEDEYGEDEDDDIEGHFDDDDEDDSDDDDDDDFDGPPMVMGPRGDELTPDQLFERATNISFDAIGVAGWSGTATVAIADAYWLPVGEGPKRIDIVYSRDNDEELVVSTMPEVPSGTLVPALHPERFKYEAITTLLGDNTERSKAVADPDYWTPTESTIELRNRLDHEPWGDLPLEVNGESVTAKVVQLGTSSAAVGVVGDVRFLIKARKLNLNDVALEVVGNLGELRKESVANAQERGVGGPFFIAREPEAVSFSDTARKSAQMAEGFAEHIAEHWEDPTKSQEIAVLFSSDVANSYDGVEGLSERIAVYQSLSHGRGVTCPSARAKTTADGAAASASIALVRQDIDADPRGYSTGWVGGGVGADTFDYDSDTSNDVSPSTSHVDVRLRFRLEGERLVITTDLPALLKDVYGDVAEAVQPSPHARLASPPAHSIKVRTEEIPGDQSLEVMDCDVHRESGFTTIRGKNYKAKVVEVNGEPQSLPEQLKPWQVRWAGKDRIVVSGHSGKRVADTVIWNVDRGEIETTLDRGPRSDDVAASAQFVASTFDYDDSPGAPSASKHPPVVSDLDGNEGAVPRGPIHEALAVFRIDGQYQLGYRTHFGGDDDIDDYYAPPICFAGEDRLIALGDENVVELRLTDGYRNLYFRPKVGYRRAIATQGDYVFIMADLDQDSDDEHVVVWEWKLGEHWATPIGIVHRDRPLDGHGTSAGVFISRTRDNTGCELVEVVERTD